MPRNPILIVNARQSPAGSDIDRQNHVRFVLEVMSLLWSLLRSPKQYGTLVNRLALHLKIATLKCRKPQLSSTLLACEKFLKPIHP